MKIPTGPRTWRNSDTGQTIRSLGAANVPFNYDDGGEWKAVRLPWRSIAAGHGVTDAPHKIDVASATIESMRMRWPASDILRAIRVRPRSLIKFNIASRTWVTLANAVAPSAIESSGSKLFLRDVYPNVDRRIEFFNNSIFDGLVFHQAARDQLAAVGGWAGHWLGSVSDIDIDFIGGAWRDHVGGIIDPDESGILFDDHFDLAVGGARVFALPAFDLIEGPTGETWQWNNPAGWIKVRRFLVVVGGGLRLVELFDPTATVVIPPGDIAHNATFGIETVGTASAGVQNFTLGYPETMGGTSGTADTFSVYLTSEGTGANRFKCAAYDMGDNYVGTSAESAAGGGANDWFDLSASGTINLSASTDYYLAPWANFATLGRIVLNIDDDKMRAGGFTYGAWPNPIGWTENTHWKDVSIHCDYTEGVAGGPPVGSLALLGVGI